MYAAEATGYTHGEELVEGAGTDRHVYEDLRRGVWTLHRWAAGLRRVHFIAYEVNGFVNCDIDNVLFVM